MIENAAGKVGKRKRPSAAETARRKATVDAWVARNGPMCPGWDRAPHLSRSLAADHVVPRFYGGEHGPLRVLCAACNVRRRYVPAMHEGEAGGET